ncbi:MULTISPECIES: 1,4-alpha-glucan branching protein [unclassified Streptomyces]|uniref:maltokinase N-terminal cap-like domain-containing protein n=1 Tax=unclassified Streptomyces TaxID=2593676 RepID=UPI00236538D6|nr:MULTISPECIES: 1,4-alpha-glucan branching protein [unclassified Streptomyces]MDF3145707.1 1,4-alpha-glucan branching protein [Streptomyces sp. T21Q-yed]WDF35415.1 1,4-alpha-glucan branching protein [Streptomyces sp. T12]
MAIIHRTTLTPTKLELLTTWLPSRPWYGGADEPRLAKAGGFRLDDPRGEVGIEFMVVTDAAGAEPVSHLVPLTYRGAPLDGAEHALVGTMEHGVLGHRWAYDGCHDPVLVAQLWALIEGRVQAQAQSISDAVDEEVTRSYAGAGLTSTQATAPATDDSDGTRLAAPDGTTLRLHRVLRPAPNAASLLPEGATAHVGGAWQLPDGTRVRGLFAALHTGARG